MCDECAVTSASVYGPRRGGGGGEEPMAMIRSRVRVPYSQQCRLGVGGEGVKDD